jgi:kynurenine--oxoglutarate transaminase/cysteine-S-conjugate beta-lyase/glutamine--phenylpyruvate transaminase
VFTLDEMERIAAIVKKWPRLMVVSDEVYKFSVHNRQSRHIHFAGLPGMFDRTLTLSSAGKTFSVTGWQVGWIVGPSRVLRDVHIALPFLQFCASVPMQQALVETLRVADHPYGGADTYYEWLCRQYEHKSALLSKALARAGLPVVASQGGYFLTVDGST